MEKVNRYAEKVREKKGWFAKKAGWGVGVGGGGRNSCLKRTPGFPNLKWCFQGFKIEALRYSSSARKARSSFS